MDVGKETGESALIDGGRQADRSLPPLVRIAQATNLESLLRLARVGGDGLTNLPPDRATLASKLAASNEALATPEVQAKGAAILLIVELAGRVVGTFLRLPERRRGLAVLQLSPDPPGVALARHRQAEGADPTQPRE